MDLQKKYFNIRPAVLCTAGLIFGILSAYLALFVNIDIGLTLFIVVLILGVFISVWHLVNKKKTLAVLSIIITLCFVFGEFLFSFSYNNNAQVGGESSFSGRVVEIYKEEKIDNAYNYSLIVKGEYLGKDNQKAYVNLTSTKRIYLGSSIWFDGYFSLPSNKDITLSMNISHFATVKDGSLTVNQPQSGAYKIKQKLLLLLEEQIPNTAHLNYAILTGDAEYVSDDVIQKYRDVGIAHLFAVSGLHIGLMYSVVLAIVKVLKVKVKPRLAIVLTVLFLYLYFCGFSVSSMRAFFIICIREIALIVGEKPDKTTNLSISCFIVLMLNSFDLFSAGFLLSFSVYLGLILLSNPLEKFLSKFIYSKISKLLSPCIVAQAVSFPILIYYFGYSSLFSFIFNLIIIPYVAIIYPIIVFSVIFVLAFPTATAFTIMPNLAFIILEYCLRFVDTTIFMVKNVSFSYSTVPYYLLLYTFSGKLNFSAKTFKILRIILFAVFLTLFLVINFI